MWKERRGEGERRKQRVVKKRDQGGKEREKNDKEVFMCARNFLSCHRERKTGVKERKEEDEYGNGKLSPLCIPER